MTSASTLTIDRNMQTSGIQKTRDSTSTVPTMLSLINFSTPDQHDSTLTYIGKTRPKVKPKVGQYDTRNDNHGQWRKFYLGEAIL